MPYRSKDPPKSPWEKQRRRQQQGTREEATTPLEGRPYRRLRKLCRPTTGRRYLAPDSSSLVMHIAVGSEALLRRCERESVAKGSIQTVISILSRRLIEPRRDNRQAAVICLPQSRQVRPNPAVMYRDTAPRRCEFQRALRVSGLCTLRIANIQPCF